MLSGTLKKYKDTGSQDPFNARLLFGLFKIRDFVYTEESERREFDNYYQQILNTMGEVEDHKKACINLIETHEAKVNSLEIIKFQKSIIEVSETIDMELNKHLKDFYTKGYRSLEFFKPLSKFIGFNVSYIFQNQKKYLKKKTELENTHNEDKYTNLIKMLDQDRKGIIQYFDTVRNKIEHEGLNLPEVKYIRSGENEVKALFPTIDNETIINTINLAWDNLFECVEDIAVALLALKLPNPLVIQYIPQENRDKSMPVKYEVGYKI